MSKREGGFLPTTTRGYGVLFVSVAVILTVGIRISIRTPSPAPSHVDPPQVTPSKATSAQTDHTSEKATRPPQAVRQPTAPGANPAQPEAAQIPPSAPPPRLEAEPDWDKRFEELRQKELARATPPKVGDNITLQRRLGSSVSGTITAIGQDTIAVNGTLFRAIQLTKESAEAVFPDIRAADEATKQVLAEQKDYQTHKTETETKIPAEEQEQQPEETAKPESPPQLHYDVVKSWEIPAKGRGKSIVIDPALSTEHDLQSLMRQLQSETRDERFAMVQVFTSREAAEMKAPMDDAPMDDQAQDADASYANNYVGRFFKNEKRNILEMEIMPQGSRGDSKMLKP